MKTDTDGPTQTVYLICRGRDATDAAQKNPELRAALNPLWTQSFRDPTVNELASKTGAGRSAFYQDFYDLYALLVTLLRGFEVSISKPKVSWVHWRRDPLPFPGEPLRGGANLAPC